MKSLAAILAIVPLSALAVTAVLQGQRMVQTVSGVMAWECTYQIVGGQRFTTVAQPGQMCSPTIDVR